MNRLQVSECALLRFLERGVGLDIEPLRANLEASLERAHKAARSIGANDYLIKADGLLFVVRGDTVTTVIDDEPGNARRAARNLSDGKA